MIKRKGLKLKPRESKHERKFVKYAESKGCIVRKFNGRKDDPDRIVLCPDGIAFFMEFKRDKNAELRDGQISRMLELANLGFNCWAVYSYEQACRVLDGFLPDETYPV